ncbi:MAG: hypothetical protein ABSE82_08005, partial [Nitrososphaerales archaeon]
MRESQIVLAVEWSLRGISTVAIVTSLYSIGAISSVTLGSSGALFILSEYCFSNYAGMNKIDSIIFGILFPAAFLSTYEIIYHFSFLPSPTSSILSQLGADLR